MKEIIVITSNLPGGLAAPFAWRFGRCQAFTVVEQEDGKINQVQVVNNQAANAMGGAGIAAAQTVGNLNPTAVLVGNLGPNAAAGLGNINAKIYRVNAQQQLTVKDVLDLYNQGQLVELSGANVGSHFGMGGGGGMGRGGGGGGGMGRGGGGGMGRGRRF
ncbi:MAG: dinitrogenase iron-molybdenum cofactor biosynthesis protein [Candidatus Lokiarchaeota archaeon]|nr:dinitrogenase iron-molybdenum cofactor biosynthesis protein [Candidatus Lokiarchaeota archaeon]